MTGSLTHIDGAGEARMVDVGAKKSTRRIARARGSLRMKPATLERILDNRIPKGDVFAAARIAGIQAAKKTAGLIPLCHTLAVDSVALDIAADRETSSLVLTAEVRCTGKTGVEMEALTAVSVAALAVYDMCKSIDRGMEIAGIRLIHKSGGKSGTFDGAQ